MMETKLWIALCALLLVNSGSAEPGVDHVPPSSASESGFDGEAAPKASAESLPASSPVPISQGATAPSTNGPGTNPSSRVTSSLSSYTTSPTTEPKKLNDTIVSEAAVPVNNRNLTDQPTSQPPLPPSGSHAPTSHFPPTSTPTIPTHTAPTTPVDKLTATPPTNKSHHVPLPNSTTPSNQPSHPKTDSSTAVLTSEPPKPKTTTTAVTQSSSTSSTSSSRKPPYSETHTTSQRTSQPDRHPETSSVAHPKLTVTPPSSPSAQAKARADGPSQLNVGGDTTMVHDSPTLDPLLAGLVSAFIITAVIITLLLFLKLRRRDNRPEFRRLQDLPMDDMMEDTPLSMYSY